VAICTQYLDFEKVVRYISPSQGGHSTGVEAVLLPEGMCVRAHFTMLRVWGVVRFANEVKWFSRYSRMCGHMSVSHPFLEIFLTAADRGIVPGHLTRAPHQGTSPGHLDIPYSKAQLLAPASAYKRYSLVLDPWAISRAGALHRTIHKMNQPAPRSAVAITKELECYCLTLKLQTAIYHSGQREQSDDKAEPDQCRGRTVEH
jgi:hypothetical protein